MIVLEDTQWLDPLSRDLLEELARPGRDRGVLLVVRSRPNGSALAGLPWAAAPTSPISCWRPGAPRPRGPWSQERHQGLAGGDPGGRAWVDTVVARAEGNAFYLGRLVECVLSHTAGAAAGRPMPRAARQPAQPGAQPHRRPGPRAPAAR